MRAAARYLSLHAAVWLGRFLPVEAGVETWTDKRGVLLVLQMSLPAGANSSDVSRRYSVRVNVANLDSGLNATNATGYNKWEYQPPIITAVPQISMWGTFLTITGRGFGATADVVALEVGATTIERLKPNVFDVSNRCWNKSTLNRYIVRVTKVEWVYPCNLPVVLCCQLFR